jgi:tetratricopeptide (TPR) repeat protein
LFLGVMTLLFQCGLTVRAQSPALPSSDAPLETWREYGNNAANKANAAAATLTTARRNEARSLFFTAFDFAGAGNLDSAKIAFERGLAIEPTNEMAEYYLADTLVKMKQVNDALPHYATALGLAPNSKQGIEAEAALRKLLSTITAARAASTAQAAQAETAFWRAAQSSGSVPDYQTYLRRYPKGTYAPLASARIAALNAEADRRQQAAAEEQRRVAAIATEARRREAQNHLQCSYTLAGSGVTGQLYVDIMGPQHVKQTTGLGAEEIISGQPNPQFNNAPWNVSVTDELIDFSIEYTKRDATGEMHASTKTTIQRQTGQFTQVTTSLYTFSFNGHTQNFVLTSAGNCTIRP